MSAKAHQRLGSTAACVVRGVQATEILTRFPAIHDEDQEVSKRLYLEIAGSEVSRLLQ